MDFPDPHYISHDGLSLATYALGPQDGPPILLVHGWPELAYSWKNTMGPLAEAGYRVIAYDLRGFGQSSAPKDGPSNGARHYGIANQVSDLEAVMDAYGIDRAVICGHDWGGIIVWHAARMLEARVSGVISICTPHVGQSPVDPIQIFKKRHGDEHYFAHFTERPGVADALFARDPDAFFRLMFRTTPKGSTPKPGQASIPQKFKAFLDAGAPDLKGKILTDADHAVYVNAYAQSGFHGGIGLYRNSSANWELTRGLNQSVRQPCLMLCPEDDVFLPPNFSDGMEALVPDLTRVIIPDCGHWAMWEQSGAINRAILAWLETA
ncbi:alpha/beta fold hydrolase [Fretibacter rubidus]|uniref:alpha/beta fold hydrolase n=1 Tax=Fretibacter rubidus TaxID=570162 RepID=UPI00352B211B